MDFSDYLASKVAMAFVEDLEKRKAQKGECCGCEHCAAQEEKGDDAVKVSNVCFDNEQDALAHARKLAMLKRGDMLTLRLKNRQDQQAVFLGYDHMNGHIIALQYKADEKTVAMSEIPVNCVA